jgi:predicted transcriptional regulator
VAQRKHPEWLSQVDERVLEFLEAETKGTPQEIADSIPQSSSNKYVNQRLSKLVEAGLAQRVARGQYRITEKGIAFLAGKEDLRDEPEPE